MSTKHALLGLLNIKDMTAYEVERFVATSISNFWNESYSNVHKTLNALYKDGQVNKRKGDARNKIIFSINEKGQETLKEWINDKNHITIYRDELLLKLFVSQKEDYPSLVEHFKVELKRLRNYEEEYESVLANMPRSSDTLSYVLTLEYGLLTTQTNITFLTKAIKELENLQ